MEHLCLKWDNYQSSVSYVFQDLKDAEQFTDVTISTGEGSIMKAHRVLLSAASSYFRDLLSSTNNWQHPVLILRDLPYTDLVALLGEGNSFSSSSLILPSLQSSSTVGASPFILTVSSLSSKLPSSLQFQDCHHKSLQRIFLLPKGRRESLAQKRLAKQYKKSLMVILSMGKKNFM